MKYSNCCCAPPWGETCDDLGFCSECMEHAVFENEGEENEGQQILLFTWIYDSDTVCNGCFLHNDTAGSWCK